MELERRIVELEIRFTEQQHLLQELNDVVVSQNRIIEALSAELTSMRQKLAAFEPGLVDAGEREKPPHY